MNYKFATACNSINDYQPGGYAYEYTYPSKFGSNQNIGIGREIEKSLSWIEYAFIALHDTSM